MKQVSKQVSINKALHQQQTVNVVLLQVMWAGGRCILLRSQCIVSVPFVALLLSTVVFVILFLSYSKQPWLYHYSFVSIVGKPLLQ